MVAFFVNQQGEKERKTLAEKRGIQGIPSIKDIDFGGNSSHRSMMHRGWNIHPVEEERRENWNKRKQIFISTVRKELFNESDGKKSSDEQIESFCILLYYTHILGDHIATGDYKDLSHIAPLVRPNNSDHPGIIPELILCFSKLFKRSQRNYGDLLHVLEDLRSRSEMLSGTQCSIDTKGKHELNRQYAKELLSILERYVPRLLEQEAFFKDTFYKHRRRS